MTYQIGDRMVTADGGMKVGIGSKKWNTDALQAKLSLGGKP